MTPTSSQTNHFCTFRAAFQCHLLLRNWCPCRCCMQLGWKKYKIVIKVILPNRNHPTWHLVGFVIFQKNWQGIWYLYKLSLWRTTWPLDFLRYYGITLFVYSGCNEIETNVAFVEPCLEHTFEDIRRTVGGWNCPCLNNTCYQALLQWLKDRWCCSVFLQRNASNIRSSVPWRSGEMLFKPSRQRNCLKTSHMFFS